MLRLISIKLLREITKYKRHFSVQTYKLSEDALNSRKSSTINNSESEIRLPPRQHACLTWRL